MIIMGIDPGARQSGYVLWDVGASLSREAAHVSNGKILEILKASAVDKINLVAIERIRGYGIVAGDDTFDTCEAVGRFDMAATFYNIPTLLCPRKDIKRHLCGNTTTNDKYIRMALIDRFGDVGTKKNPGKLYGISGHLWAALAVCVYAADNMIGAQKP